MSKKKGDYNWDITRRCAGCGKEKPRDAFPGKSNLCRDCFNENNKKKYAIIKIIRPYAKNS